MSIGTESLPSYYAIELGHAAHRLVTEVRPVQPGQQVLITGDTQSDMRVIEAVAGAVMAAGGIPTVVWYATLPQPMMNPPVPAAAAMAAAEVWIDFSVAYQLYSPAYNEAIRNRCVYVCLTGMDVDMLVRTIGKAPYAPMKAMAEWLYSRSQAAKKVHVTNPAGTDLWMEIDLAGDPFWEPPSPDIGFSQMLGGQSGLWAYRESYEGSLVFDGCIWPPAEIGILQAPVHLTIEKGYIKKIEGGYQADLFANYLEEAHNPLAYLMEHTCYGFNPGVTRPSGRILEDERVFGCMQFGIGAYPLGSPVHTDGVCLNGSVWLDDEQIMDKGRYVHPELVELCRQMGVSGY